MRKSQIFNTILSAIEAETEVSRQDILSRKKQPDIVDARCLLYYCLREADFYPSQIARMCGHSRQSVSAAINGFDTRCRFSGKMLSKFLQDIRKKLTSMCLN